MTGTLVAELGAALSPDRVPRRRHRTGAVQARRVQHRGSCRRRVLPDEQRRRCRPACRSPFVTAGRSSPAVQAPVWPVGQLRSTTPMMIVTTKMNRVLSVDPVNRLAWVQPGVLNLDLTRAVSPLGLHFAPDPSSQQSCSIGGNVANNSGGPHCLSDGVTTAHVLGLEVVLPTVRSCSSAARKVSRRDTTCAVRSSAARACAVSPRRCASA